MFQIFFGSLILSTLHALIPNHWLPLIAVGKTENWSQNQTLLTTIITGIAHTVSTILLGIAVGFIGYKLSQGYSAISETIAPVILIGMGMIYVFLDLHSNHNGKNKEAVAGAGAEMDRQRWITILFSLSLAMFLTPSIEIETYYFEVGSIGWMGIFIVSAVYLISTVGVMLFLVYYGMKGINTFKSRVLETYEKSITGIVLLGLGILALLVKL